MTDSDKDLTQRLRQYLNSKYEVTVCYNGLRDEAANRIDELVESNKELTLQLLATSGQAADALDKLAKAVEALRFYAPTKRHLTERWFIQNFGGHDDGELAAATLAELEGKE
jgi:allophanate hydrolase subunit 1